jgi:beta-lactamase class A
MVRFTIAVIAVSLGFAGCSIQRIEGTSNVTVPSPTGAPITTPTPSPTPTPDSELSAEIAKIAEEANGKVGVYAELIETGQSVSLNPDEHFAMQSLVKVPISMAVLKMVDQGKVRLGQLVNVQEYDMATANQRSPIRDRFPQGTQMIAEEVIKDAIVESDGTASDVLQRVAGGARGVQAYVDSLGVTDVKIVWSHREFGSEWSRQYDNWLTPRSATLLLRRLWSFSSHSVDKKGREAGGANVLSAQAADLLLKFMSESKNPDNRILGMLPEGTIVAHKTGTGGTQNGITSATNDIGIITLPNGNHIAISVLVGDSKADASIRAGVIAKITKAVFDKWSPGSKEPVKSANFNERHTLN